MTTIKWPHKVGTAWTFRGKKGLHCFPGEVTGHGELSEVDSGQGGTARVHRQRVGHGCGIIQQQTAAPERNVQGVLALVGSCEMLVAGMPPKRQSSCNACVPRRPYCDTLRWDCVSTCVSLALGAGCFSFQCISTLVRMSSG